MDNDRHKYRIYSESYNDYLNEESLANMRLAPDGQLYSIGGTIALGGTIEMCTGLKDKNGKLIFEGDKIEYKNSVESGIATIEMYCHNMCAMWIEQRTDSPSLMTPLIYLGCSKELEIIGNIHKEV